MDSVDLFEDTGVAELLRTAAAFLKNASADDWLLARPALGRSPARSYPPTPARPSAGGGSAPER